MIPAAFLWLDALPLTANGKVDRHALPAPDGVRPGLAAGFVAPRTPIEELLAGMFRDLLGTERVGVRDDFFELGGHSLQGIRLMARICEAFGVDLKVKELFAAPTVEGLAVAIAQRLVELTDEAEVSAILADLDGEDRAMEAYGR